jgi:UDP-galactopyranose mutase
LGYAGVIDERIDLHLIRDTAKLRPDWNLVLIGPVVKIDPASLPKAHNLHWLGMQDYQDLPSFFAGWDVAIMPFALNDATRFISPTKTPEFLSAGLPVVSTPVRDVVRPYGDLGLARIASTADEFVAACDQAMAFKMGMKWRERADAFLETMSWDSVWLSMNLLVERLLDSRESRPDALFESIPGEAAHV